jgi:hypothetical protein
MRLPAPYSAPQIVAQDFITTPAEFNSEIPANVDLICGDPLLELQSNAISTLANNQIPGTNAWVAVHGDLGRRQRHDQPAAAGVDRGTAEQVTQKDSIGLGVGAVQDGMSSGDHCSSSSAIDVA